MQLINARPSPYGRKVSIAMLEKGVEFETIWDQPWGEETIVRDKSPMEQLPILITDAGEMVCESDFILEWLEHHYPEPSLFLSGADRLEIKRLQMLTNGLMDAFGRAIFEVKRDDCSEAWLDRQTRKIPKVLDELSKACAGREFAVANRLTAADICVVCVLHIMEFVADDFDAGLEQLLWRRSHPDLIAYVDRLDERDSFKATRPQSFGEMPFEKLHG